jgi:hypothetical protein
MRKDFQVALILAVAAFPAGLAVSEALEYFSFLKEQRGISLLASSVVTLVLLAIAAIVAIRAEREAERRGAKKRMVPLVGMIVCGIAFLGFASWYFWPGKTEAVAEKSLLDGQIQIASDLAQYPTVVPQNTFFELQLNNNFMREGGVFTTWSQPAGSPLPPRDPSVVPSRGIRLRISNYGKIAVVNARVTFPIEFLAVRKGDTGISSGEIIKSNTATTNPFSIGPGEIVDIYAMNYSINAFARVLVPPTAQGYMPGSDKLETFKLIAPVFAGMGLLPFVPKSPPVEPPPVPVPPSRPKGK